MAKKSSTIRFYDYSTSPYSRVETTLNEIMTEVPESPPFVTGGVWGAGGDVFYFEHVASAEPVTAEKLLAVGTTAGSHSSGNTTCSEKANLLKAFVTDAGVPNYAGALIGQWTFRLECAELIMGVGCPDLVKYIYCKIYKRSGVGENTYLGMTNKATVAGGPLFKNLYWNATGSMVATDRLWIEVWAEFYDLGLII